MSCLILFPGMVDTGLGKKSVPLLLWLALKPLRYVMMKHAQEGLLNLVVGDLFFPRFCCLLMVDGVCCFALLLIALMLLLLLPPLSWILMRSQLLRTFYVQLSLRTMAFTWLIQVNSKACLFFVHHCSAAATHSALRPGH
jgi:hypothetical protein